MIKKKWIGVALLAAALVMFAIALTACTRGQARDLEGVDPKDPDKVELYTNVDQHPNVVRLCIDGVAFATTTRQFDSIQRVVEWDDWCKR